MEITVKTNMNSALKEYTGYLGEEKTHFISIANRKINKYFMITIKTMYIYEINNKNYIKIGQQVSF